MKWTFYGFLLLWLSAHTSAYAQYQKEYFWWGAPASVVHDSLRAQGYWQEASFGDAKTDTPDTHLEAFTTIDLSTVAIFTYYEGILIRRSWRTDKHSSVSKFLEYLISSGNKLSEGRWLNTQTGLVIRRTGELSEGLTYVVEPDWDHELDKLLRSAIKAKSIQNAK